MLGNKIGHAAAALALTIVACVLAAAAAGAATSRGLAVWDPVTGGPGAFTTAVELPGLGYPQARVTTSAASASLSSGASTWFGASTAPGQVLGSSRDRPYLTLSPAANNATSPSVTTYEFPGDVPIGWSLVVGDIDSDEVQVSAILADGSRASTAQLGFQGTFNPCDSSPRPSGCSTSDPKDQPSWDPTTATLRGNATGRNTYGASGWFTPTVPLRSLTLTFTWRTGLPIFQTWLGAVARDVEGTVSSPDGCDVSATLLQLLDAQDRVLADTRPDADGSYRFTGVAATDAFRVRVGGVPTGCTATGPLDRPVDLRSADDRVDVVLARDAAATGVIAGTVTEEGTGDPVAGVDVTLRPTEDPASEPVTTTSDEDGAYTLPPVPPGIYEVTVDPPTGHEAGEPQEVTVPDGGGR